MLSLKSFQAALLVAAVFGLGFAPTAEASNSCKNNRSYQNDSRNSRSSVKSNYSRSNSQRGYSNSRTQVTYRNDNVRVSVGFGSDRSHRSNDYRRSTHGSHSRNAKVVYQQPQSGYWKRVYRSPVYQTRYDAYGRSYRVCVRAGYYERVWVSTSRRY